MIKSFVMIGLNISDKGYDTNFEPFFCRVRVFIPLGGVERILECAGGYGVV